jgi:hypothetical protein
MFLSDALDVPAEVLEYMADQLGVADASCVKRYTERDKTRLEHAWEIQAALGLTDFASAEAEVATWLDARAWTTGDGPKAMFTDVVAWLRERDVLLPGANRLARLVARVREEAAQRLWSTVAGLLDERGRQLLEVPAGGRASDLERWRRCPTRASGPGDDPARDLLRRRCPKRSVKRVAGRR